MSEAVSALKNASFDGLARVEECGLRGMITLRGDLSAKALRTVVKLMTGVDMPEANRANTSGEHGLCWMSPDELLVLCPYGEVAANLTRITTALAKQHHLAVDVSDARALFRVRGPSAREVLAKLCPVDLTPGVFQPGMFRRTRMAQVPAAFWMEDGECFAIVCFRSVAEYAFNLLCVAADPASGVGYFQPLASSSSRSD